ncbi:MAG: GIY-YIG nuclease family protein [Dehalococcoidia bacterium]
MTSRNYYVYILASRSKVLYVGVTNDLERRLAQHRSNSDRGFVARYNVDRLVWFGDTDDVVSAIEIEKQIKGWRRARKVELIEADNPEWSDLSLEWGLPGRSFVSDSG